PADAGPVLAQCTDPLSQAWTTIPVPYSLADAESFVGRFVPEGWSQGRWAFAVEAPDDPDDTGAGRFCGTVELRDQGSGRAEVAFGSHPWARGRGLMTRAVGLLLDWGFAARGLTTVIWWANKGNWASRRLAWRLGFGFDGVVRSWQPQRGELLHGWVGVLTAGDERRPRRPWYDAPVVHGTRVVLRAHEERDVVRVQEAGADARTLDLLAHFPDPFTEQAARDYLEGRAELGATGSGIGFTAADPRTDEALSFLSLFRVRAGLDAEVGYFTHPDARGRGLTEEAVRLVCRHAFVPVEDGGMGLRRLTLRTIEANLASRRVAEATGFRLVGRERRADRRRDDSRVDALYYDLLPEELTRARP
ncbi:MAG: GNAT family N-acetyltransferase, partial [Nocardioidaceae bacterium]